mgnify:FL=1
MSKAKVVYNRKLGISVCSVLGEYDKVIENTLCYNLILRALQTTLQRKAARIAIRKIAKEFGLNFRFSFINSCPEDLPKVDYHMFKGKPTVYLPYSEEMEKYEGEYPHFRLNLHVILHELAHVMEYKEMKRLHNLLKCLFFLPEKYKHKIWDWFGHRRSFIRNFEVLLNWAHKKDLMTDCWYVPQV